MIEDARAMIRQQWAADMRTIDMIHVGYKCKFVDNVSAHVAMQSVGNGMERQKIDAGLIGAPEARGGRTYGDRCGFQGWSSGKRSSVVFSDAFVTGLGRFP
jgi:hypothetical protein